MSTSISDDKCVVDNIKVDIQIPYEQERLAEIAYDVMRVDKEPKRNMLNKQMSLQGNIFKISFEGKEPKKVQVGVNHFFEQLALVNETITEFRPAVSTKYDHYN